MCSMRWSLLLCTLVRWQTPVDIIKGWVVIFFMCFSYAFNYNFIQLLWHGVDFINEWQKVWQRASLTSVTSASAGMAALERLVVDIEYMHAWREGVIVCRCLEQSGVQSGASDERVCFRVPCCRPRVHTRNRYCRRRTRGEKSQMWHPACGHCLCTLILDCLVVDSLNRYINALKTHFTKSDLLRVDRTHISSCPDTKDCNAASHGGLKSQPSGWADVHVC